MAANKIQKRTDKLRDKKHKLISLMGIKNDFESLPISVRRKIIDFTWPKPSIDIDGVKNFPEINNLKNSIIEEIIHTKININEGSIPLSDIGHVIGIDSALHSIMFFLSQKKDLSKKCGNPDKLLDTVTKLEQTVFPIASKAWLECGVKLLSLTWNSISSYYDFSKKGLYFTLDIEKSPGKKVYQSIKIHEYEPVVRIFNIDNKPRKAYLCHSFNAINMSPIVIEKNAIKNICPLNIYIQDHAISRILERLKIKKSQMGNMFYNIGLSLEKPEITCKDGDSYLVPFYLHNSTRLKLGYFLVGFAEDCAIIKSFKFITMGGTPENFNLKTKLSACKTDLEYFNLDSIDFLNSDIFDDPNLRSIFKKCNLSHLFDIKDQIGFDSPSFSMADDFKKYFRLD